MQRLGIALVPILLTVAACVHEAARPPQASAEPAEVPAPAPSPAMTNAAPAEQPQAASPAPLSDASAPSAAAATPAADGNSKSATAAVPPRSPGTRADASAAKAAPASAAPLHATQEPPTTAVPNAAGLPSPTSPTTSATAPALDLKALEQRLRDTHAIGVFTKLSLKNQVDDLLAQFKTFYRGQSQITLAQLRQKYEVLLMKAVSVLQDNDPQLASAISSSREAIWNVLADPKSFANI
jgi:hypothetical protein